MPFLDINNIPLVQELKENFDTILNEFIAVRDHGRGTQKINVPTHFKEEFFLGEVDNYILLTESGIMSPEEAQNYLNNYRSTQDKIKTRRQFTPYMNSLISRYPEMRQCYFTTAHPGAKINRHYGANGVTQGKIPDHFRFQMVLVPGEECYFYIEDDAGNTDSIKYTDGLVFGFRDGAEIHWVENKGNLPRTVLIIDIWSSEVTDNLPLLKK